MRSSRGGRGRRGVWGCADELFVDTLRSGRMRIGDPPLYVLLLATGSSEAVPAFAPHQSDIDSC